VAAGVLMHLRGWRGWQPRDLDREIAASTQISKPSTGSAKVAPRSAWRWSASTAAP